MTVWRNRVGRLLEAIHGVLRDSYHVGGRWVCQVYHRSGQRCRICGCEIQSVKLAEEVVRRSPAWRCTLVGGVLEQEGNALFEAAL